MSFRAKRWLPGLACLTLVVTPVGTALAQETLRPKAMVILVDVTSSLTEGQHESSKRVVQEIIRGCRTLDSFRIYPIHQDPQRSTAIAYNVLHPVSNTGERLQRERELARQSREVAEYLDYLYERVNQDGAPERRSCIIESLQLPPQVFEDLDRSRFDSLEVILVSDMIEDCPRSPFSAAVDLDTRDISRQIDIVRREGSRLSCSLEDIAVTVVLPPALDALTSSSQQRRPPVAELREFWRLLLENCGVAGEPESFRFSSEIPDRFVRR